MPHEPPETKAAKLSKWRGQMVRLNPSIYFLNLWFWYREFFGLATLESGTLCEGLKVGYLPSVDLSMFSVLFLGPLQTTYVVAITNPLIW